ncbi:hypothetical protein VTL71DRAFT_8896 [Oculimacula yallundae]|uniref:2EXR domain-containing protein n=1 Tax=Oculimacula yallundae TaxID=86028 RepID=A0ABR4BUV9_9HELO
MNRIQAMLPTQPRTDSWKRACQREILALEEMWKARLFLFKHNSSAKIRRWQESRRATQAVPLFSRFSSLPAEIRLRIWSLALSTPQIIVIETVRLQRSVYGFESLVPRTPFLRVDKESRHEATKVQRSLSVSRESSSFKNPRRSMRIIVNLNVDILWFQDNICSLYAMRLSSAIEFEGTYRIKNIAISWKKWQRCFETTDLGWHHWDFYQILLAIQLNGVQDISLVVGDTTGHHRRGLRFVAAERQPIEASKGMGFLNAFDVDDRSSYDDFQAVIAGFTRKIHTAVVAAKRDRNPSILYQEFPWANRILHNWYDSMTQWDENWILPTFQFVEVRWE